MLHFSLIDYVVFLVLLILGIIAPKLISKKTSTLSHFLITGRKLSLPLFTLSLVSTWYGGIFGVTQLAYDQGIYNFITQGVFWYCIYAVYALWVVPKLREKMHHSIPEWCVAHFGAKSSNVASWLNFINTLPVAYFVSLALFLKLIFALSYYESLFFTSLLCIPTFYVANWKESLFQDAYQTVFMLIGLLTCTALTFYHYGSPVKLLEILPPSYFSITGNQSVWNTCAWGFLALTTLIDPSFHFRTMSAADNSVAKKGIFFSMIFWCLIDCCTTLGGMYARAYAPQVENAYFYFTLGFLPSGLQGLFLFTLFITILSSLDSYLFLSMEFNPLKKYFPTKPQRAKIFPLLMCLTLGLIFGTNITDIWLTIGGLVASSLLIPMFLKIKFKHLPISATIFNISSWITTIGFSIIWCYFLVIHSQIPILYFGLFINGCCYLYLLKWHQQPTHTHFRKHKSRQS